MESPNPFVATLREWTGVFMRRSMHHLLLYSKDSGLSMSQIGALQLIHHRGVSGVSGMGSNLGITSAAASQMLERLVHQGLVARSEDPHDRRVKQIALTEKGHQVLQESAQAHLGWLDALASLLTPQEQNQVMMALTILIERANQFEHERRPERD
jgi:MarR family 2-MHQ and catechol resistance regulon transcriptional repressor